MCLPWGNAITDTAVDGSLPVQVRTVEVNAVPAPVIPGDRARLNATRGSEVIIVATATTIWIVPIDIPISIVSRTTATGTTDRGYTAVSSRPMLVTTASTRVQRSILQRVVTVAVIGVRSTASSSIMLVGLIRNISETGARSRWRRRCWSINGRRRGTITHADSWSRLLNSGVLCWVKRCRPRLVLLWLLRLPLELAGLCDVGTTFGCVRGGMAHSTRDRKVGDDRGLLSLWRISRIRVLGLRRLLGLTSVSRLGHGIPCLLTKLGCFSSSSRNCTAD
jgi:hypothetical protein